MVDARRAAVYEPELRKLFSVFDVAGDGVISAEEFCQAQHLVAEALSEDVDNQGVPQFSLDAPAQWRLQAMKQAGFDDVDLNGDGCVSFQEFKRWQLAIINVSSKTSTTKRKYLNGLISDLEQQHAKMKPEEGNEEAEQLKKLVSDMGPGAEDGGAGPGDLKPGCGKHRCRKRGHLASRVQLRRGIDWSKADPGKWDFPQVEFGGSYSYTHAPEVTEVEGVISKGIEDVKAHPDLYDGLFYQSNMVDWPEDQQKYKLVKRTGSGFEAHAVEGGGFTWMKAKYEALPPDVEVEADAYTDAMSYGGFSLGAPRMPGRGQACADVPAVRLIDIAHPRDISQGGVGDCWLLCAMSAVAEYKGVIANLFKNTPNLHERPLEAFNKYAVTLWDLSGEEWSQVDVVVDERLCSKPDGCSILGCLPTLTGELWACYLEKAVAAHCGGWDAISGGTCTHAWRLLLGCKHVYTFKRHKEGFKCYGTYNPNENKWEQLDNSPHKGFQALWPMAWPEVGGGGDGEQALNEEEFFDRLCEWDDANYIMAMGSAEGSDTTDVEGIVQGHAYTLLECVDEPAGVTLDLVKVRNPWGKGEFEAGKWTDEGSGWVKYPEVKAALKPTDRDDGIFWMEKDELFKYFPTFYLCALDMTTLQ